METPTPMGGYMGQWVESTNLIKLELVDII